MNQKLVFRLLAGMALALFASACSLPSYEPPKTPEALQVPKVITGGGAFEKKVFRELRTLGRVSEIRSGHFHGKDSKELAIVGSGGALFLNEQGVTKHSVTFEHGRMFFFVPPTPQTDEVNLIDIEGDGVTEFLNRGHHLNPVILFNNSGKVIWKYDAFGKNDAAAGDMDDDGRPEIVVGFNGFGGVHLLDSSGKERWQQSDGNVWRVAMLDIDGDGRPEILHSNAAGDLTARNVTGKTLWARDLSVYVGHFSPTRWGADIEPQHLLVLEDNAIHILSSQAQPVAELNAPWLDRFGDAFGTVVRFPGRDPLYATVVGYFIFDRSFFFLHDLKGALVYQEVLDSDCSAVLALPEGKSERLLVGCTGKVYEYLPVTPSQPNRSQKPQ